MAMAGTRAGLGAVAAAVVVVAGLAVSPAAAAAPQAVTRAVPEAAPVVPGAPVSGRTLTVGPGKQYATVQAAANAAQPGDNVAIAPGTYSGGLSVKTNGTAGKYITFYGDGGTAVLQGGGGSNGLIALGNHAYQRFLNITSAGSSGFGAYGSGGHDLQFQNFGVAGSQDGGLVLLATKNILVDGCDIHGTNAKGTSANHEALTVGSGSSGIEVEHCTVHDNGEEGIDVKYDDDAQAKVHDNVSSGNRGPDIYVDSSTGVQVYANVTSGTTNNTKAGIGLAIEDYSTSRKLGNVSVFDNVSYGNAQSGLSFWVESSGTMSNVQIVNNTFAGNAKHSIEFDGGKFGGTNVLRNNIFGEGPVSNGSFTSDHNVTGDPGFVDPAHGDFHLKAGSTKAIDQGSASGAPAFDLDGVARPAGAGFDIGAYEQ
jgi:hypothetical protein